MKIKNILLLAVVLAMTACSNQENVESTPTFPHQSVSDIRSYAEALKIAQEAIPMLNDGSTTRSESSYSRKIDISKKEVIKIDAKTRGNSGINDTIIYVFNFENNEGFALVSASKNTEGLLAITEKGHCDPSSRSNVCGFEIFLDLAKEYVANSKSRDLIDYKDSVVSSYDYVGPYVTVKWGKYYPEGEFCPNNIAGCVNIAMAQIMTKFQYPSSINLTYAGRDKSSQTLNWSAMKLHSAGHAVSYCSDTTTHKSIGRLHRQLGEMNHSSYNSDGTGTTSEYIIPTFNILGYSYGNWSSYTGTSARNELNNGHVFLMLGTATPEGGHGWVFDGYMKKTDVHYEMINSGYGWVPTGEIHNVISYYNHMNWGWYGNNNGYFSENVYNTSQAISWDMSNNIYNLDFNTDINLLGVYH